MSVWPGVIYDELAKALIYEFKYARAQAAACDIARVIVSRIPNDEVLDAVTHVPTASARVRQRGYDQAKLVAGELARKLGLPCPVLLARAGQQRQVGTGGVTRREQLRGAFRPLRQPFMQNKRILLVDDVLTTGATIESAAAELKSAGAKRVCAAVFAQA